MAHSDVLTENWAQGRYNKISIPAHGFSVITSLQLDPEFIITCSDDTTINVYDIATGELLHKLEGHEGGVWCLSLYKNTLFSGSTDRTVRVWDVRRGICTHVLRGFGSTIRTMALLVPQLNERTGRMEPEVPLIVGGSRDATMRIWDVPDVSDAPPAAGFEMGCEDPPIIVEDDVLVRKVLKGHTHSVRSVAAAGTTIVSGSYDRTVKVWNTDGDLVHNCVGHEEKVYSVGYCHASERAASGSMDATVKVWSTRTGEILFNLRGHTSLVGLLAYPTDRIIISAAADATLRVWSSDSGECLAKITGHDAAICCFHYDPASGRLLSGSEGGVKMWDLASSPPGRSMGEFMNDVDAVWRVRSDGRRMVAAVQKSGGRTILEVLDFAESDSYGKVLKHPIEN
ncbi:SCF ubiquitin ligase complex subunit cdc4 [Thoreauomyces humboldtii]|nr:SCF ubiquitin ligase complex subunit cdc4 [Thoreauomyces humboldtii]